MAILLGADPRWYLEQEERQHNATLNVARALSDYEDRRRRRSGEMLDFFRDNPGSAQGEFGKMFLERYGDDPMLAAAFSEAQRQDAIRSRFFEESDKAQAAYQVDLGAARDANRNQRTTEAMSAMAGGAGIGGALASAMAPVAEHYGDLADTQTLGLMQRDPTGFQEAFSSTPPMDRALLAQQLQRLNMPLTRLVPDATPDPLLRLATSGEIDPSTYVQAEVARAGAGLSPEWLMQRDIISEDQRELARVQHGYRVEEQEGRFEDQQTLQNQRIAAAAGKGGTTNRKQALAELEGMVYAAVPSLELPKSGSIKNPGQEAEWKMADKRRESQRKSFSKEAARVMLNLNLDHARSLASIKEMLAKGRSFEEILAQMRAKSG